MATKLVYFAWVRERIGLSEEERDLPGGLTTAADVIAWLASQGEEYAHAFAEPTVIRVAADQTHVTHDTDIRKARELAFFPPVTGG